MPSVEGRDHFSEMEAMTQIRRIQPGCHYSEAVVHGHTVYLAGQVANDTSQGIEGQTREVLATIDHLLREAGSDKSRLLMVQIFLPDLADYSGMNKVWEAWVAPGQAPCRATVQSRLAQDAWRVEIVVTAATGP
jgi:enamine deaminase RidA (YjgF/YER057c/UK114 family)